MIRRADRNDLPRLLELGAEYCTADGHDIDLDRMRAGFAGLLDDDAHGVVVVVDVDGSVEGYGVVTWGWSVEIGGREAVLDELYVRSRNRGLGSQLVAEIERECAGRGVLRIFLETERPNDAARRLYGRLGYAEDDSIWMSKELF